MKIFSNWSGKALGVLLVLLLLTSGWIFWRTSSRMEKSYNTSLSDLKIDSDPDSIREGKRLYLARGCVECHGEDLTGKTFIDDPAIGTYSGANLTGLKNPSKIARSIRKGIGQNDKPLIFMPSTDYKGLSDEDTAKIIAYLQSVPEVEEPSNEISIGPVARILFFMGKFPALVSAESIDQTLIPPKRMDAAVNIEFGSYMAQACTGCHRENFSGGPIEGAPPEWPPAANLITGKSRDWKLDGFMKAIRTGFRPDGTKIQPPMPWKTFAHMTDVELSALKQYLDSL